MHTVNKSTHPSPFLLPSSSAWAKKKPLAFAAGFQAFWSSGHPRASWSPWSLTSQQLVREAEAIIANAAEGANTFVHSVHKSTFWEQACR